jgi:hypothetical protein
MKNDSKKKYEPPTVVLIGDVARLTGGCGAGSNMDSITYATGFNGNSDYWRHCFS